MKNCFTLKKVIIEVLESGAIQMSWRVRGRHETVHVGVNVLDNRYVAHS